jgi:hypothetical protein
MEVERVFDELGALLEAEEIEAEVALRLLLRAQGVTLARVARVEETVIGINQHLLRYPSGLWLWQHRRADVALGVLVVVLLVVALVAPERVVGMVEMIVGMVQ